MGIQVQPVCCDGTAQYIYWADKFYHAIRRCRLDGSDPQTVVAGNQIPAGLLSPSPSPQAIATDSLHGHVYFGALSKPDAETLSSSRLFRAPIEGGPAVEIIDTHDNTGLYDLTLDPKSETVYWTNNAGDKMSRCKFDGSGLIDLVSSGISAPWGIAIHIATQKLFYIPQVLDGGQFVPRLRRLNVDGQGEIELLRFTSSNNHSFLTVDQVHGHIYYADGPELRRMNLGGSGDVQLLAGPVTIDYLTLDRPSGHIYFNDPFRIRRVNLDGTGLITIISSLSGDGPAYAPGEIGQPWGVALW